MARATLTRAQAAQVARDERAKAFGGGGSTKKVLIALHPRMQHEMDQAAADQMRTRSDFVREAIRKAIAEHKLQSLQLSNAVASSALPQE